MARAKNGQAISDVHRTVEERMQLAIVLEGARAAGDLVTWRRAKAITEYMEGVRVVDIVKMINVGRSTINTWLRIYETQGADGLIPRKPPGTKSRLTPEQHQELKTTLAAGPQTAGFTSGVWTGPLVRQYISEHFGVDYHIKHLSWLLHKLGFSVQRPRKKLARADPQAQAQWIDERLPAIKEKAQDCGAVVLFEDEASFWLDGTLHQTWSPVGVQPRVPTFGQRKTGHVFGAISLEDAAFHYRFAPVFNGHTFHEFLEQLVAYYDNRKIFLIMDNSPCHWLDDAGKAWLAENQHAIELHRLPPYSPEFNPTEAVWKTTRKLVTHNRFFATVPERDAALTAAFDRFRAEPSQLEAHVARFQ